MRDDRNDQLKSFNCPKVSFLISAYNEEKVIEEKLENSLELDYPADKIEIVVVSDASSDQTDIKVRKFSEKGIRLFRQEVREGKAIALNKAVPQVKGEIIIFSDGNSLYNKSSIRKLVSHFQDPSVGFVTGKTIYCSRNGKSITNSANFYSKLEQLIKNLESKIGSCVGADGAIFAIRKELYTPLQAYDINDFVIPLKIIEKGYRGVFEDEGYCSEEAKDSEGEFKRQIRITNRTIRGIFNNKVLLNPIKFPLFSFELFSHKVLKLMIPFFLITLFISNYIIFASSTLYSFYILIFLLQILYYTTVIWGYWVMKTKYRNRLLSIAYIFCLVSIAILIGWIKYFSGVTYSTWSPERT